MSTTKIPWQDRDYNGVESHIKEMLGKYEEDSGLALERRKAAYIALPEREKYLTFVAEDDVSTIRFKYTGENEQALTISVSTDYGGTWVNKQASPEGTLLAHLKRGEMLLVRGDNDKYGEVTGEPANRFDITQRTAAIGNIMSLLSSKDFATNLEGGALAFNHIFDSCTGLISAPLLPATSLDNWCYAGMFNGCTSLATAPLLPATTLANDCYYGMFYHCSSLTTAPALPATTLMLGCYEYMFALCYSLIVAPELPATTLAQECYRGMFNKCQSLVNAPELPATTLFGACYQNMFRDCTSLTETPELPATTLAISCYWEMFSGCTALTVALTLPATTLVQSCYGYMFNNCSSLRYVKCLATDISARYSVSHWLTGVPNTGTFVKADSMTGWPSGADGIPSGWTVVNESDEN